MKTLKKALIAVSLAAMALPSIASAEPYRQPQRYEQTQQIDQHRYFNVNGHRYEAQRGPAWNAPRGYQHRNWQRDQRLPSDYRRVVVTDYRGHHLPPPNRGQHWVRVDNDAVLVGVTSGLIGAVIANAFMN